MRIIDRSLVNDRYAERVFVPASAGIQRRLALAAEAHRRADGRLGTIVPVALATWLFLAALAIAAVLPFLWGPDKGAGTPGNAHLEIASPASFEGQPLVRLPLSPVESRFAAQFPGRIGRFTDGRRDIIVRAVEQPTRLLHPAADCFRGIGYSVATPGVMERPDGTAWSCFKAARDGAERSVCERIHDGRGGAWSDVSAWYWAAMLGQTQGPWWAVTVVDEL